MKGVSWRFVSGQGGAIYKILEIIGIIRTIPEPTAMHFYKIESKFSELVRPSLEPCKSLHSGRSFVLVELSFARMPSRQYCLSVNRVHCHN